MQRATEEARSPATWWRTACAGIMAVLVLAGVSRRGAGQERSSDSATAAFERTLVNAIEKAGRSVVAIARVDPWESSRHGDRFQPRASKPGEPDFVPDQFATGVIVDGEGFILTQYHIVRAKSEHYVTTTEGNTYPARILVSDPRSDLAMLKLDPADLKRKGEYLTAIRFGDATKLKRGQIVVSLGNPYAIARDGQASASWGIISNLSRKLPANPIDGGRKDKLYHFGTLIQTDAKLNLGTSGGALVNRDGEMIGLTTSLAATAGYEQAAGYAIPVDDMLRRAVESMKQGHEVEYGFLGVGPEAVAANDRTQSVRGVRVASIYPGTPADLAGVQVDDVVTHIDDRPIRDADSLILEVGAKPVDSVVRLAVLREGRARKIDVKLTKFPVRGERIVSAPTILRGLRVDYSTASIEDLQKVGNAELLRGGCVLITEVERDSPAWEAKLQAGMFVTEVGGKRVASPSEFRTAVLGKSGSLELKVFGLDRLDAPQPRTIKPTAG